MLKINLVQSQLKATPKRWLITGVAGFIGSNLLEMLLSLGQSVVGLDNFSTGHQYNMEEVKKTVTLEQWNGFTFIEGDIRDYATCLSAVSGVDYVLHQAALGSVPRSIADPVLTNSANITGFLNMLSASKDGGVKNFVYAASSSTYGDHPALPKIEEHIGKPLSPYAVTKYVNELYADVFWSAYNFNTVGLRYFNVFGKRQDPNGAYAAVIPKWTTAMILGEDVFINGDGENSRDFCFIENVIQANLLAATAGEQGRNQVYNVAVGGRTSLNELFSYILDALKENGVSYEKKPFYKGFRAGDVKHSQADISKISSLLGYQAEYKMLQGISHAIPWYISQNTR